MAEPTAEEWAEIDAMILAGNILGSIMRIRVIYGVGINDAKVVNLGRYRLLRVARPDEFMCNDEEYWRGVYD